jgi:RHS repeat-associated protein
LKSMTDAVAGTTKTQTFGDVAHQHAVTASGADTFTYNANGSTVTRNVNGVASSLAWTPQNRLQSVTTTSTTSYRYDAGGQRIATITPVYTTVYLDGLLEIKSRKRDFGSKGTFTGDVNGDGKADLIEINDNDITVRISQGTYFTAASTFYTGSYTGVSAYLVGDVNGDGKADLVVVAGSTVLASLSTGTAFGAPVAWYNGAQPAGTQQIYLANVDTVPVLPAKPTSDLIFIGTAATAGAATVIVRASNGTSFGANTTWSTDSIVGTNGVADMNNDGRADLVTSPGTPNNVYVRLSSGTTFAAGAGTSWGAATGVNMRAIDVTGDGKADLVDPTTTTVRVAGTGTYGAATVWAATSLTGPQGAIFGNIDGTGGNDVIGGSNTTNIQVRLSNNTTAFVAANGFYEPFSFATKRYYMAGTVPVAVIDAANIGYHWLAGDTQGTTSLDVPDAGGTAGITYQRYKPYGQQRGGDTITTTDHGYLGQIEDTTGLTYLNNRYYDPTTARFISVDPLVAITGQAYSYGSNNPLSFSDPSGLAASRDPDCTGDKDCNGMAPGGRGSVWGDDGSYYGTIRGPRSYDAGSFDPERPDNYQRDLENNLYNFSSNFAAATARVSRGGATSAELLAFAHLRELVRAGLLALGREGGLLAVGTLPNVDFDVTLDNAGTLVRTRFGSRSRDNQADQDALDAMTSVSGQVSIALGFACLVTAEVCGLFVAAGVGSTLLAAESAHNTCSADGAGSGSTACGAARFGFGVSLLSNFVPNAPGVVTSLATTTIGTTVGFAYADTAHAGFVYSLY